MTETLTSSLTGARSLGAGIVSWGDYAEGYASGTVEVEYRSVQPVNVGFAAWKDMADEPWKYGDDIEDWLDLDTELRNAPGRWRLDAYWLAVQQRQDWERLLGMLRRAWNDYLSRKDRMATRIQAVVRGHLARNKILWRDCCMCLAHHVSPIKTDVGFMCKKCSEDGPHSDLIGMEDPWDWYRAEK